MSQRKTVSDNGTGLTQDGKRRWISGWEYTKLFGPIEYNAPDLRNDKTVCKWCGGNLTGRKSSFCSKRCSEEYARIVTWGRGTPMIPWCVVCRDGFTCQDCGESAILINKHGMPIPNKGRLDVHHIIPVSQGGSDIMSNLITLCRGCHKRRHA